MSKDTSIIPKGDYCYGDDNKKCPYWSMVDDKPEQANGYCSYLEKGDWDINLESNIVDNKGNVLSVPGEESPISIGLLFDQVKECGKNEWAEKEWEQMIKNGRVVEHRSSDNKGEIK